MSTSGMTPLASQTMLPALSKGEARSIELSARRHWRAASRNALLFAAELRRLHDGGAHLVRGFANFGVYAQQTFDGLNPNTAKQLSRQGGVLLTLQEHDRVDLDAAGRLPVGPTALRQLSLIANQFGDDAMLTVYDHARALQPDRPIAETIVKEAIRQIYGAPQPRILPTAPEPADELEDDEDLDEDELAEPIHDLIDRLDILRQHVDDLRLNVAHPDLARREMRNIQDEVEQVYAALTIAHPAADD